MTKRYPTATTDSLAAFRIAETTTYALMRRDDLITTLHAFDDTMPDATLDDRIRRFCDIECDEISDDDTLMHFDDADNIDLDAIINDDFYNMLLTAMHDLCDMLNIE
jgi:hypothetical protein